MGSQRSGSAASLNFLFHVDQVILHDLLLAVEVLGLEVELGAIDQSLGGGQADDLALDGAGAVALTMFMETCAMPRSSSMKPMALQLRKPPEEPRMTLAIFLAISTSEVSRLQLNATSGIRAPMAVMPAVGWILRSP